jgi:hypothetical protein
MGALACVTTGFEVIARHPELTLFPLVLDLFLWLGPRLSIAPILQDIKALMSQLMLADVAMPDVGESYAIAVQILEELSQGFNLFSLLDPGPLLGVPVLMPNFLSSLRPIGNQPALEVASVLVLLLWLPVLAGVGLGLNAVYLRSVGRHVIAETDSSLPGPKTVWTLWRQFIEFGLVIFAIVFSFSLALSFVGTLVGLLSFALAGLLMTLASSILLFIGLHLLFTVPGIVLLQRRLFAAMKESLLLTRGDFLNVVFLLGLILVISRGLNVVWTLPKPDSWSTLVGLVGHAFVSTALTAAFFVFYQERLRYVEAIRTLSGAKEAPVPSGVE